MSDRWLFAAHILRRLPMLTYLGGKKQRRYLVWTAAPSRLSLTGVRTAISMAKEENLHGD